MAIAAIQVFGQSENILNFIPMVVEVFGAWGLKSAPVFSFASRAVALHRNLDEERSDTYLRQALCVTLQRYNANSLLKHRNPLTPTADGPVPLVQDSLKKRIWQVGNARILREWRLLCRQAAH